MASTVDICNLALSHVGGNTIMSLDDNSVEASLCKLQYPSAVRKCLEDREWTFAIKRQVLASMSRSPVFGCDSAFQLPSDCIWVVEAFSGADGMGSGRVPNSTEWEVEGNTISANVSDRLYIRYVSQIDDPSKFSSGFTQVLSHYLAYKLAVPIAQSRQLQSDMYQLYQRTLADASVGDGRQGRSRRIRSSRLVRARLR